MRLGVGQTLDVTIQLPILALTETVAVTGTSMRIAAATDARLADTVRPHRDPRASAAAA